MKYNNNRIKTNKELITDFEIQFDAHISTSREYKYIEPVPRIFDTDTLLAYSYTSVPCIAVHFSKEAFEKLIQQNEYKCILEEQATRTAVLERNANRAARIRETNPAIKLAYDKYVTLLDLVWNDK
jgi:hypothetical protein